MHPARVITIIGRNLWSAFYKRSAQRLKEEREKLYEISSHLQNERE